MDTAKIQQLSKYNCMKICNIELIQFRNYDRFDTELSSKLNWIYGSNGQGKTNLVESIHYLCNLESFRTNKITNIIQKNNSEALINALIESRNYNHDVRINVSKKGRQVFIDNNPSYQVSEYILSFMALAFTPESLSLFKSAPQDRRKFFNKIISFLNPVYFKDLQKFNKIIVQKNASLRSGSIDQIPIWNKMLSHSAKKLIQQRLKFVEQVNVYLHDLFMEVSGRSESLSLIYEPSFNLTCFEEKDFFKQLERIQKKELHQGYSIIGPHRDEFHLMMNDQKDKDFFSQGEFRITNLSLKMTINRLLYKRYKFYPILIFDDLFSELDEEVVNHVIQVLIKVNNQIFITSTSKPSHSLPGKCIKIEQGMQV